MSNIDFIKLVNSNSTNMKIVILTQDDTFTIPQNIEKIIKLSNVKVALVVNINSKYSLVNNKILFFKGFGLLQVTSLGFKVIKNKFLVNIDSIFGKFIDVKSKSLKSVARKFNIPYKIIDNPNSDSFLNDLYSIAPDLIVSFSAPLVFKTKLLSLPKFGCINLHCSFLPHFAGVMPSFWALYKKQKTTGVTVHQMDSKIDNGIILKQKEVEIDENETIFSLILKTKKVGGNLMCEVISDLINGYTDVKINDPSQGSYFGWPKVNDFKQFKNEGGRLV